MLKTKSGGQIDEKKAKDIASGGEGTIKEHPLDKKSVLKVYHQARKDSFAKHLESLSTLSDVFIKPIEVLYNNKGEVGGFIMKYVNLNDYYLFNNLFNKGFCTSNGITKDFKIKLLGKLKDAIEELHSKNIQFGDCNPYNILFSISGDLLIVDVDSFQTPTQPHSMVLIQEITDWTSPNSVTKQTDIWAWDVLSFWSTTYCHPFKWVAPGNKDSLQQRVVQGKSILSKIPNLKIPALYEAPDSKTEPQFKEIFGGRRYYVNFDNSVSPSSSVVRNVVTSTSLQIRELFQHVTEVNVCSDFISVRSNNTWFYVETKIPKITRTIGTTDKIQSFPSNLGKLVTFQGNTLEGDFGSINFVQPEFFYYNGFLTVIDYGTDIQHNFNLNNQLGGIDQTQTPIFAKSIVIRDTPIQNFGGKKYLNIPINNSYTLLEVPLGTKNAKHNGVFYCMEYTEGNQIKFRMKTVGHITGMDLDYLPHFTSKLDTLFIPEDGYISVVKHFVELGRLDASMCSRTSKLYSCNSGILLLENNILYLLNTK